MADQMLRGGCNHAPKFHLRGRSDRVCVGQMEAVGPPVIPSTRYRACGTIYLWLAWYDAVVPV